MTDFKITLVVRDVTYGDIADILDDLEAHGEEFDVAKGEFILSCSEGDYDRNSWFSSEAFEEARSE